ncbi:MAG: 3-hydroxybutyrate dehydrogenase [Pseudomonadota bacterium]
MHKRLALITGSTSGIGLGIAKVMAANSYNLIINGFGDEAEIAKVIDELQQHKIEAKYYPTDLTKPDDIKLMISDAVQHFGTNIDLLVNNAGMQHVAMIEDFQTENWDKIISLNLSAAFHTISAVMTQMKQNNFGRIINIASAHGLVASANKAAYVASKHGVIGLTKVVALETAKCENLTCNAVCPGWVLTPLVEKQIVKISNENNISYDEAKIQLLSEKQPSEEFVTVDQIGEMVKYLCSDAARSITGAALSIDGGWTAR